MASNALKYLLSPMPLFTSAFLLRAVLLVYGLWQDVNSPLKYTDIDYLVFTDAARFTFSSAGPRSPYARETYRYTPLLAWMLYPTTFPGVFWFSFGKILFAAADLVAGWLIVLILQKHVGMDSQRALKYASIWLLNPMVATISTRGSSEGLLGVMVMSLLYAVLEKRINIAGFLLGFGVHFKIYPFIYAPAIVWWMDAKRMGTKAPVNNTSLIMRFLTPKRLRLGIISLVTFFVLNLFFYGIYVDDFFYQTFWHHVTRVDHRHNFSPYNTLLYLTSAQPIIGGLGIERLAFIPQLLLSTVLIPLVCAKKNLPATMLAQTFAFVTFNKVCTSQYFLWYMVFLPLYLPNSALLRKPRTSLAALALWVSTQALWLWQAYNLEFLGKSTFIWGHPTLKLLGQTISMPGLLHSSLAFFLVNCWILGLMLE